MQKSNLKKLCEKFHVNYNAARSYQNRYRELSNEYVIIHYRPDVYINIFGELVCDDK